MEGYDDIDDAYAAFEALVKSRDDALNRCEVELAAGRTGLVAYRSAAQLQAQLDAFAAKLTVAIERERQSL